MAKGKKTGGRKKGVLNKGNAELKEMILMALDEAQEGGGIEYLKTQAIVNPTAFMSLVGKVLPLTVIGDKDKPLEHNVSISIVPVKPRQV